MIYMVYLEIMILIYVTIVFGVYIYMAHRAYRKFKPITKINDNKPSVSVVVPAYNESVVIINSINSLLSQDYQNFNIVIVDDGSTDNTSELLEEQFGSNDNVVIITSETNLGKSDALNYGVNHADGEWILFMDADTLLEPNCISRFIETLNPDSSASACMVSILNGSTVEDGKVIDPIIPKKILPRIQWIEYLRTSVMWRASTIDKNSTVVIAGACGLVKKSALLEVGGFKDEFIGEDMELTLNLHKHGKKIQFISEVLAWTEVPETIKDLKKQRLRWFRGSVQSLIEYRGLIGFKNKNKFLGRFLLPFIWFADMLGPWVELLGLVMTIIAISNDNMNITSFLFIWCYAAVLHSIASLLVLRFARKKIPKLVNNKNYLKVYLVFMLEPFTYHMLHAVWMIRAHACHYLGIKPKWNKVERKKDCIICKDDTTQKK